MMEIDWDEHPDGEGYYGFGNDGGNALYVIDLLDSGRWRLFIGAELVRDGECNVIKWSDPQGAKDYARDDLASRIARLRR